MASRCQLAEAVGSALKGSHTQHLVAVEPPTAVTASGFAGILTSFPQS